MDKIKTKGPVRIVAFLTFNGAYRVAMFEEVGKTKSSILAEKIIRPDGYGVQEPTPKLRNQVRQQAREFATRVKSVKHYEPAWVAEDYEPLEGQTS